MNISTDESYDLDSPLNYELLGNLRELGLSSVSMLVGREHIFFQPRPLVVIPNWSDILSHNISSPYLLECIEVPEVSLLKLSSQGVEVFQGVSYGSSPEDYFLKGGYYNSSSKKIVSSQILPAVSSSYTFSKDRVFVGSHKNDYSGLSFSKLENMLRSLD